jgi:hypothetical protein
MSGVVDWLLAQIAKLCEARYTYADDVGIYDIPHPLEMWAASVRRKWKTFGLPGPVQAPEFFDFKDYTPGQVAWMLDYDQKLLQGVGTPAPNPDTPEMWRYIVIKDPWTQRVGLWALKWFTYGTTCTCCHGWRLILAGTVLFGAGWLVG